MSSDTYTGTMLSGTAAPGGDDRVAPSSRNISQVPYMPGLDGLRAIAVVAVLPVLVLFNLSDAPTGLLESRNLALLGNTLALTT